jgi:hypothetical protein
VKKTGLTVHAGVQDMEHAVHEAGVLDIAKLAEGLVLSNGLSGGFLDGDVVMEAVFECEKAALDTHVHLPVDVGA